MQVFLLIRIKTDCKWRLLNFNVTDSEKTTVIFHLPIYIRKSHESSIAIFFSMEMFCIFCAQLQHVLQNQYRFIYRSLFILRSKRHVVTSLILSL